MDEVISNCGKCKYAHKGQYYVVQWTNMNILFNQNSIEKKNAKKIKSTEVIIDFSVRNPNGH